MYFLQTKNVVTFTFLLKSQENLHGKIGVRSNFFVSLLTVKYKPYLQWLGQSQNLIELLIPFLKNSLSLQEMAAK